MSKLKFSKAGRYAKTGSSGGCCWSVDDDRIIINAITACNDELEMKRCCTNLAKQFSRGHRGGTSAAINGRLVMRRLWGLAIGAAQYAAVNRGWKIIDDGSWSWPEIQIVKWAARSKSKQRGKVVEPTPEYIAGMLGRKVEHVRMMFNVYGPARGRGPGLWTNQLQE